MSEAASAALAPKVPHACVVCDAMCREILATSDGVPTKWGKRLPGTRVAELQHRDGTISTHTLCAACEIKPADMERIWERQCLLYVQGCRPEHFESGHVDAFCANVPLGVLEMRSDERIPVRIMRKKTA